MSGKRNSEGFVHAIVAEDIRKLPDTWRVVVGLRYSDRKAGRDLGSLYISNGADLDAGLRRAPASRRIGGQSGPT